MKCNVCGADVNITDKKCATCGSVIDRTASMKSAISNISSLASALKAKRESLNTSDEKEESLKKVHSVDDFYAKDINIEPSEEEFSDSFDLNAFYQNVPEEEDEEELEIPEYEEETEDDEAEDDVVDEDSEKGVEEGSNYVEDSDTNDDAEESVEDDTNDDAEDEVLEEENVVPIYDEESQEDTSGGIEIDIEDADSTASEEELKEESNEEEGIFIELDEHPTLNDNGYIKESDIHYGDSTADVESTSIGVAEESINVEQDTTEDTSPMAFDEANSNVPRAEDIPFTQLEEVNSSVSENNPIIIGDKDVVSLGEDGKSSQPATEDKKGEKKEKKEKVKYNKFCGVMAVILIVLATLASAVILLEHFVLSTLPSNVVFDFIIEFLSDPDMLMYFVLGTLVAYVLALIFSIVQTCIKPRKMGKVLLILTILFAGGICAGYYFADNLLEMAVEYVKALFM